MTRDRSIASNASALLICGLLAGLVVAAAAFPSLAVAGLTAKASADGFENLPDTLAEPPTPQTTWVYADDGKTLITSFYDESRKEVSLDQIAPVMIDAIIAAEDNRFYEHNGVDLFGVIRAGVANQGSGDVEQGASTLTMQYVRQALTYNAKTNEEILKATEDTPQRKLREMRYAVAVEKELSKKEILQRYLNLVFLGNQSYGIYAASHAYFDKDPADLELAEAALLAALPKAPGTIDPTLDDEEAGKAAKERRDYVLDGMVKTKSISKDEAAKAKKSKVELNVQEQPNECVAVPSKHLDWGFFCDYLKQWWMNNPDFGQSKEERLAKLKQGGYKIVTSLDADLQEKAQKHIADGQSKNSPWALGTVTIDPKSGHIRSMAINRDYKLDDSENGKNSNPDLPDAKGSYPNTTVPLLTGDSLGSEAGAGFQAGSTFKMFTMAAALNEGIPLTTTFKNKTPYASKEFSGGWSPSQATCKKHLPDGSYAWCVKNDTPKWMDISADMWKGFGRSINTYFVQLIEKVGAKKVVKMAEQLGIDWRTHENLDFATDGCKGKYEKAQGLCLEPEKWGALTLGVADTTALDLAEAYGTVAAEGKHCKPLPVMEIEDPRGNKIDAADPDCDPALTKDVARATADAMRCPVGDQATYGKCNGATFPDGHKIVNRPLIGKTGTTDHNQASWYVASTPNLTTAGFIADPDYRDKSLDSSMHNIPHVAASKTMKDGLEGMKKEEFKKPPEDLVYGKNAVDIPSLDCVSPDKAESILSEAGFEPVRSNSGDSDCKAGEAFGTSPTGKAPKGSEVIYFVAGDDKDDKNKKDYLPPTTDRHRVPPYSVYQLSDDPPRSMIGRRE
jgi:membrane peptidoglycan carboxypeptidase